MAEQTKAEAQQTVPASCRTRRSVETLRKLGMGTSPSASFSKLDEFDGE